jgi:mRNA interferase MazF
MPITKTGMIIKRSYIYFANLSPTVGSEINKTRPVFVISNDINNQYSNTITIIPVTSNITTVRSFEIFIPAGEANLPKDSKAKCDQIRTIDKSRFLNEVGKLSLEYIVGIEVAVRRHLEM